MRLWKATSGAQWVLSSTWRVREDYIRDILEALQEFGIGAFHFEDITDPTLHSERQWEIYDWLQKNHHHHHQGNNNSNKKKICWLALDDEELVEGETNANYKSLFQGHVIKTESNVGLTMEDVDTAISLWNSQLAG
jgi:hypothetical protein